MKRIHTAITVGLMAFTSLSLIGQSGPMDYSEGKQDGMKNGRGHNRRPDPTQIVEHMFVLYDLDEDGELVGEELSDTTYDMVSHRPPRPHQESSEEVDLECLAMKLESRLLGDFDSDESGGISPEELVAAMESRKPPRAEMERR